MILPQEVCYTPIRNDKRSRLIVASGRIASDSIETTEAPSPVEAGEDLDHARQTLSASHTDTDRLFEAVLFRFSLAEPLRYYTTHTSVGIG